MFERNIYNWEWTLCLISKKTLVLHRENLWYTVWKYYQNSLELCVCTRGVKATLSLVQTRWTNELILLTFLLSPGRFRRFSCTNPFPRLLIFKCRFTLLIESGDIVYTVMVCYGRIDEVRSDMECHLEWKTQILIVLLAVWRSVSSLLSVSHFLSKLWSFQYLLSTTNKNLWLQLQKPLLRKE